MRWTGWCDHMVDESLGQSMCCNGICDYPHKPLFFTLDAEGKRRPWKDEDEDD